jgi:alginate O-acetyltransferase complex protein AlgI
MLFSSPLFLFLFLPVLLVLYFLVGPRFRNAILLVASLLFYSWGEGTYVVVMLAIIAVNFALGRLIEALPEGIASRSVLAFAVVIDLGLLIAFKYSNFLVQQLNAVLAMAHVPAIDLPPVHLPLGISFFTFHAVSYVIDISRRKVIAGTPLNFALYMTLFPHAIAGPIVRYGDIIAQIRERVVTSAEFAEGVRRFILGLSKKVLIANSVAVVADAIFAIPARELNFGLSWLGITCYTLQIYFDFSGYSDMAIGLAKLFGIDFLENFNYPYTARSLTDFWRRWHISLSSWFRDYLYIPLGGNRRGPVRTYLNLLIVFFLCGLWHGASWTFAGWGLFHGLFLVLERRRLGRFIESLWAPVQHLYAIVVVAVGWVLFRAESLSQAAAFLRAMVGFGRGSGLAYHPALYLDSQVSLALVAGVLGSAPLLPLIARLRDESQVAVPKMIRGVLTGGVAVVELVSLSVLFLMSTMLLAAGTYNPFIYFRF